MKNWLQLLVSIALIVFTISTFAEEPTPKPYGRLISFGDSLSDLGTYGVAALPYNGGKFTTNPGLIWVEVIAAKLNLEVKPNRQEGFGLPMRELGGLSYAQGGARVVLPRQKAKDDEVPTLSARPVADQVGLFLMSNKNFNADDLVLIQGGANDLFTQLMNLQAGKIKPEEALANVAQAADDLSVIITNLKMNGARKVVVLGLPAVEKTPRVLGFDPQVQQLVAGLVAAFNQTLAQKVLGLNVLLIDLYHFDVDFNANYAQLGFTDVTHTACKTNNLPMGSSLFCSSKNLVETDADMKFKFADEIHPSAGFSKVVGEFIFTEIMK